MFSLDEFVLNILKSKYKLLGLVVLPEIMTVFEKSTCLVVAYLVLQHDGILVIP